jgi:leucyl-tRNA synthetase
MKNLQLKNRLLVFLLKGMVCHETYKDQNNNWLSPEEVTSINGKKYLKDNTLVEVKVGSSESMSKSKKKYD